MKKFNNAWMKWIYIGLFALIFTSGLIALSTTGVSAHSQTSDTTQCCTHHYYHPSHYDNSSSSNSNCFWPFLIVFVIIAIFSAIGKYSRSKNRQNNYPMPKDDNNYRNRD